jgi:CTP synthase (UTP-ammonia lyase)
LGIDDADHEESAQNAPVKLISKLTCSLSGQRRNVRIVPGSQVHRIYGTTDTAELFACNYGLNEAFQGQIQSKQLRISGYDDDGTARIAELPDHPFFVSTLFLPQINSQPGNPHPLIAAFLQSAAQLQRVLR